MAAPPIPPRRPLWITVPGALLATALDALLLVLALGGVGATLSHPRAPTLLAVWFAGNLLLPLRQPLRGHAPHAVRAESPVVMLALFVLPMLAAPISALGERFGWWPLAGGDALRWGGVALAAAGLAMRLSAMSQLGARFSPRVALQPVHALETRGLYAWVRHPGYLGAWLTALGGALAFGSGVGLAIALLMLVAYIPRVRTEERLMAEHFGAAWSDYRRHTRALIPGVF